MIFTPEEELEYLLYSFKAIQIALEDFYKAHPHMKGERNEQAN